MACVLCLPQLGSVPAAYAVVAAWRLLLAQGFIQA